MTVYRWVQRFTPLLIDAARPTRHVTGDRWSVDKTYMKVAGRRVYLYRAIDQYGRVIDVLVSEKRDLATTRSYHTRNPSTQQLPHVGIWTRTLSRPRMSITRVALGR